MPELFKFGLVSINADRLIRQGQTFDNSACINRPTWYLDLPLKYVLCLFDQLAN